MRTRLVLLGLLATSLVLSCSSSDTAGPAGPAREGLRPAPAPDQILISPTAVDFGSVDLGTTAYEDVQITNQGASPIVVEMAGGAPIHNPPFSAYQNCAGNTLAPGASCQLTFTFTPTALGPANSWTNGTVNGQWFEVTLEGNGTIDGDGDGHAGPADNCPRVANPDQWDQNDDGTGNACEESQGRASGRGTSHHVTGSDQPRALARFEFDLSARSSPAGTFTYDLGLFRGRLVAEEITYLEVNGSHIYAEGTGSWNGMPGRRWCLYARDPRDGGDWLEVRIAKLGDARYGSCRNPWWHFVGVVQSGNITARPENGVHE